MNPRDIVILSTADWDNPFWTNKQHTALQLVARGYRVLYIDSLGLRKPSSTRQDLQRIWRRLQKAARYPQLIREGLWVWSPALLPIQTSPIARFFNATLLNWGLGFHLTRLGLRRDILWTYNPLTSFLLKLESFKTIVYHCVDEIKAQPGMPVDIIETGDRELVSKSDLVFVTSPKLLEKRRPLNPETHYFPNVADYDHFSKAMNAHTAVPQDLSSIPTPRIGFIGAISGYKVDFSLLRFIADEKPEWSIVLIGKIGEGEPMTDASVIENVPNIHLLGPRTYSELPSYLKGFDVALLPNRLNEYTESMFPMKFFEYLSAGKPVVSVNLPALRDYRHVVSVAISPREFVQKINTILAGNCPDIIDRLAVAKNNTYASRTENMLKIVGRVPT